MSALTVTTIRGLISGKRVKTVKCRNPYTVDRIPGGHDDMMFRGDISANYDAVLFDSSTVIQLPPSAVCTDNTDSHRYFSFGVSCINYRYAATGNFRVTDSTGKPVKFCMYVDSPDYTILIEHGIDKPIILLDYLPANFPSLTITVDTADISPDANLSVTLTTEDMIVYDGQLNAAISGVVLFRTLDTSADADDAGIVTYLYSPLTGAIVKS